MNARFWDSAFLGGIASQLRKAYIAGQAQCCLPNSVAGRAEACEGGLAIRDAAQIVCALSRRLGAGF